MEYKYTGSRKKFLKKYFTRCHDFFFKKSKGVWLAMSWEKEESTFHWKNGNERVTFTNWLYHNDDGDLAVSISKNNDDDYCSVIYEKPSETDCSHFLARLKDKSLELLMFRSLLMAIDAGWENIDITSIPNECNE